MCAIGYDVGHRNLFLGSAGTATLTGFDLRRASAVGVLMNSSGLTELIAIFTTVITAPLFRVIYQDRLRGEDQPDGGKSQGRPQIAGPAEVPPHRGLRLVERMGRAVQLGIRG
jgi:hypothetical protein